jgi:hypothetical protein
VAPTADLHERLQSALGTAYALERELGGGGMARVSVATDARLGWRVAVKVLHPDLAAGVSAARFEREVRLAAQLQHPHLVPRFAGSPLHSRRAAAWHWWASNPGLAFMVAGFAARATATSVGTPVLATSGVLAAVGAYTFAYVLWRTIDGPAPLRAAARRARVAAGVGVRLPLSAPGATSGAAGQAARGE